MKVSIVIPVYNVAPYIERCLRSIVSQTYQTFECIIIDDCGTDGSIYYVEQFIHNYSGEIRFSILRHQHNYGPSAARNTGMRAASSDYIYFMDSDDEITPDCLEVLLDLAEKYPDADYVQGDTITGTEELMKGCINSNVPEFCNNKQQLEDIILCKSHKTAWNKLLKRSFLINNALFFPIGIVMEDHHWTYFVAKYAHAVAFTHQGTYYYYKNKGSIVNSKSKYQYIKNYSSYMSIIDTILTDLLNRNDIQQCHNVYLGETIASCMINLSRLHSFSHWCKFWKTAWSLAYKLKTRFTWRRLLFFFCMMPPCCLMAGNAGWQWRIRQYLIKNL